MSPGPHRILRNFGLLTTGRFLGDAVSLLFFITIARVYGQRGMGEYSFAMALTGLLLVLADFGLYTLSVREISRVRDTFSEHAGRLLTARLVFAVLAMVVLTVLTIALPVIRDMQWVFFCVGTCQVMLTLVDGVGAVFLALEEMHLSAVLDLSFRLSTAAIGTGIALAGGDLRVVIIALPLVAGLYAVAAAGYCRARHRVSPIRLTIPEFIGIARKAMPFASHQLLSQVAPRSGLAVLGFLMGTEAVGIYNAGYRFLNVLLMIPALIGIVVLPAASRLYRDSRDAVMALLRSTLQACILLAFPMAAGLWLVAPELITMLFGEEYRSSISIVRILAAVVPFAFLRVAAESFLAASDNQQHVVTGHAIAAVASVALPLVLIRGWGAQGAAWAALLTEALLMVALMSPLARAVGRPPLAITAFAAASGAGLFLVLFAVWRPGLSWIIPLSVLIYVAVVIAFPSIRNDAVLQWWKILSRRPGSPEAAGTRLPLKASAESEPQLRETT